MYNDYYLQQIDNKLADTNGKLDDILERQDFISQTVYSGDSHFIQYTDSFNEYKQRDLYYTINILLFLITVIFLLVFSKMFNRK